MTMSSNIYTTLFLLSLFVTALLVIPGAATVQNASGAEVTTATVRDISGAGISKWYSNSSENNCEKCHGVTSVGQSLNKQNCAECHESGNLPSGPFISRQVHFRHENRQLELRNLSSVPDEHPPFSSRQMFECSKCHGSEPMSCQSCHSPDYHGDDRTCTDCHGTFGRFYDHEIDLVGSHDRFGCQFCHEKETGELSRLNSQSVSLQQPHELCWQCHSDVYGEWLDGSHHVSAFEPELEKRTAHGDVINRVEIQQQRSQQLRIWSDKNSCTNCHNPHRVSADEKPIFQSQGPSGTTIHTLLKSLSSRNIAVAGVIILILAILVAIAISELVESSPTSIIPMIGKHLKIRAQQLRADIKVGITQIPNRLRIAVVLLVVVLLLFKIFFGVFMPMIVVESQSMKPGIERGDLVFYVDYDSGDRIRTFDEVNAQNRSTLPYTQFGSYGDVLVFTAENSQTPLVHRAIRRVNKSEHMWNSGQKAPYSGYITKGDNNEQIDQKTDLMDAPVNENQIQGIAVFNIPEVGWVKIIVDQIL